MCQGVSTIDLDKAKPFPATLRKTKSHRTTVEMHPTHPALEVNTFPDDTFIQPLDPEDVEKNFKENA